MKKIICISLVSFLLTATNSFSQDINLPADSIAIILCKKWEIDYAIVGGMKIGKMPGATEVYFEFNRNMTVLVTGKDPKDTSKGTWGYDPKKKIIKLTIDGDSNQCIVSLKEGEFVMLIDAREATPDDPKDIKMVFKTRKE